MKDDAPKRKRRNIEPTKLLHVNLPARIVDNIRSIAAKERRTITAQVELIIEESPNFISHGDNRIRDYPS